ncbi:CapA family protein [Demequina subtropica]|uniref:CapA family protein n=1 Tax=Demequina subtropica TaxID=1638989 RepID=UPI0009E60A62|nr:CapA family protein [Demequina subtropica]
MTSPDRTVPSRALRTSLASAALVAAIAVGLALSAGATQDDAVTPDAAAASPAAVALPSPAPTATEASASPSPSASPAPSATPGPVRFTLVAGGDVLPHGSVNASASTADGYDYTALMEGVRPYIEGADLALCHMEVPVAPEGTRPSDHPIFAAPPELVRDLGAVGWDGCSTASNHSVDQGTAGVAATLAAFDDALMQHAGTARTEAESERTSFYVVQDGDTLVKVAHLSFTWSTNGLPVSAPWQVGTVNVHAADATPIVEAAQRARDEGADVVVASVHCCVEYETEPTAAQRALATKVAESGLVDLYIGHHAHVPQPIELLPGGPTGEGMWTAFGLGNFLSSQGADCCAPASTSGVLLATTFTVAPGGAVAVEAGWVPITVDRSSAHAMHVLTAIPDGAGTLSAAEVAARLAMMRDAVGDAATELTAPPGRRAEHAFPLLDPAPAA